MSNTTSTDGATILTVPANTLWYGSIILSASLTTAAGLVAAASATPNITVSGAGGNLVNGDTVAKLQLNTPAQLVGALSGSTCHGSQVVGPMNVQARANPVSLILNTGGATAATGTAIGEM